MVPLLLRRFKDDMRHGSGGVGVEEGLWVYRGDWQQDSRYVTAILFVCQRYLPRLQKVFAQYVLRHWAEFELVTPTAGHASVQQKQTNTL